jgi:hypothetical protein
MSRIYAGDMASIDTEVLEALKALPNDYWVLAGFTVGREVDWLIVRTARPMEHSAIIITELKRYEHNIRGVSQDAVWERQDIDGEWHPIEGGYADRNPYWQAVNGANALKHWLWNNQRLYLGMNGHTIERAEDEFGAWPIVLILSPPGVEHLLPLRPTSRYGAWVYDLERWLSMLQSWRPRKGVGLSSADMAKLVAALGLEEVHRGPDEEIDYEPSEGIMQGDPASQFMAWLHEMNARVQELSERVERLENERIEQERPDPMRRRRLTLGPHDSGGYS